MTISAKPTIADADLDRLLHNKHAITLKEIPCAGKPTRVQIAESDHRPRQLPGPVNMITSPIRLDLPEARRSRDYQPQWTVH